MKIKTKVIKQNQETKVFFFNLFDFKVPKVSPNKENNCIRSFPTLIFFNKNNKNIETIC